MLSEGRSVKEIGQELYLSQATVRDIRSLLRALGALTAREALAEARLAGLLAAWKLSLPANP